MIGQKELQIFVNFFSDSAKIIFASLVIGILVPDAAGKIPWLTCLVGLAMTILFLSISLKLSKMDSGES